jgi:hypothetical protein
LGEIVAVTAAAVRVSLDPQFAFGRSVILRVVGVRLEPALAGWAWLTGDQLDTSGREVWRREVFVWVPGLQRVRPPLCADTAEQC